MRIILIKRIMPCFITLGILFLLSSFNQSAFAQNSGDYRTANSGDWEDAANWEVYDGTVWVAASEWPGDTPGTYSVTVSERKNNADIVQNNLFLFGTPTATRFVVWNASTSISRTVYWMAIGK